MSRPKLERVHVSFTASVEIAARYWDGGDALGFWIALIPMTAFWYRLRGVPRATRASALAQRNTSRVPSGWRAFGAYALLIFGFVVVIGLVVAGIVVLL